MMLSVPEPIGQLRLVRERNGKIAGARLVYPKVNEGQDDQCDRPIRHGFYVITVIIKTYKLIKLLPGPNLHPRKTT
ncbi:hypothetical protein ANCDUO_01631 [Ancylostoma duodenale]|uniref:Uncharacterized protein n=1 Tax=Ancylostoma duodenale TaxID=51022 RepID=A0A0C2H8Q9_9BILA|nr:hypothetical protein ANCDUO_01631 [Ancylostoma duodenale]